MAQGETGGDDLAVSLSWPGAGAAPEPAPVRPPPLRPSVDEKKPDPAPPAPRSRPTRPSRQSSAPVVAEPRRAASPTRRPRPATQAASRTTASETLVSILDHLSTLSRLVTGTSKASAAELEVLGSRVEKAVAEFDALQLRVLRSLAGFDALRLRVQKELADRPPLSDAEIGRIADAVTERLLSHVRVETESPR